MLKILTLVRGGRGGPDLYLEISSRVKQQCMTDSQVSVELLQVGTAQCNRMSDVPEHTISLGAVGPVNKFIIR